MADGGASVLVVDAGPGTANRRVIKYTADGQYVSEFNGATNRNAQFASPRTVAAAPDGMIYVADSQATASALNAVQKCACACARHVCAHTPVTHVSQAHTCKHPYPPPPPTVFTQRRNTP
jgi:hypothetical protein